MARTEFSKRNEIDHRISTDQKLELIKTVRMQNQYNRNQCRERERILYGVSAPKGELFASESSIALSPHIKMEPETISLQKSTSLSGFRLRFLAAMILFGLFIFADINKIDILGKNMDEIATMLQDSFQLTSVIPSWNSIDL